MIKYLTNHLKRPFRLFLANKYKKVLENEYKAQQYMPNERIVEYSFILNSLLKVTPKTILDVGPGTSSFPHMLSICGFKVTAMDNITDYWGNSGVSNRHIFILEDDITNTKTNKKFDFISCISTLEHIKDHNKAIDSMFSLLNPNGYIALTFPYNESSYVENIYDDPEATFGKHVLYICHVFSRNEIENWLKRNNGIIIDQEYYKIYSGKFHTFGEDLYPPQKVLRSERHQLSCLLIKKN